MGRKAFGWRGQTALIIKPSSLSLLLCTHRHTHTHTHNKPTSAHTHLLSAAPLPWSLSISMWDSSSGGLTDESHTHTLGLMLLEVVPLHDASSSSTHACRWGGLWWWWVGQQWFDAHLQCGCTCKQHNQQASAPVHASSTPRHTHTDTRTCPVATSARLGWIARQQMGAVWPCVANGGVLLCA